MGVSLKFYDIYLASPTWHMNSKTGSNRNMYNELNRSHIDLMDEYSAYVKNTELIIQAQK